MGKGLDVGTSFIYCAERQGREMTFRSQRDAFFDIEYSDFTQEMLTKSKVNYIKKGDHLYVVGNEAIKFANIFNRDARRPLSKGIISPSEKEALPMVELVIKSVIGTPNHDGEIVYYSVPGTPIDADFNLIYHEKIIHGFLTKQDYIPKSINEGLAVVFSELADEGFTGIGISFGGGMANVCLSLMSVPVVTFSLTKAGDWIDQQVAMAVDETQSRICAVKESNLDLTKEEGLTKIETALSIYYNYLIEYVLKNIRKEFEKKRRMPRIDKPITIVLSGGTTLPKGFLQRFKGILSQIPLPVEIGKVKMASEPLHSVAKGALIAAIAEEERR